jgi:hypothetical protein
MIVHLIDGTYELFRHFYGQRSFNQGKDKPLGAVAGVLHSVLEISGADAAAAGCCGMGWQPMTTIVTTAAHITARERDNGAMCRPNGLAKLQAS